MHLEVHDGIFNERFEKIKNVHKIKKVKKRKKRGRNKKRKKRFLHSKHAQKALKDPAGAAHDVLQSPDQWSNNGEARGSLAHLKDLMVPTKHLF